MSVWPRTSAICSSGTPEADSSDAAEWRSSLGDHRPMPAATVRRARSRRRLLGLIGVPTLVGKTRSRSCQRSPASRRSSRCRRSCRRSASSTGRGRTRARLDFLVFGAPRTSASRPSSSVVRSETGSQRARRRFYPRAVTDVLRTAPPSKHTLAASAERKQPASERSVFDVNGYPKVEPLGRQGFGPTEIVLLCPCTQG